MKKRRPRHDKPILKALTFCALVILVGTISFQACVYINNQHDINEKNVKIQLIKEKAAVIEALRKKPVYITLPGAKPIRAIVDDYTKPDSIWAIVGKTHPISTEYIPPDLKIPDVATRTDKSDDERSVRAIANTPLKMMFEAAAKAGHNLMIGSGYRSAALQKVYFDSLAGSVGEVDANQAIAKPGQSEHQTGLAVDISTLSRSCYLDQCFATTADGLWLADNSYKYGFILRFPRGSEAITGYQYEPWHFRYVGVDLATALHESNLTLDAAWPYLQTAEKTLRKNGAI
ncbi:MAG: M15 family metallopeptidase [Candidatus Saccharibacteria bacterium]|nr:M15 family metallopeptidase [Candidatus Saccharibacteria bacterium]